MKGINKLSLNLGVENNSTDVAAKTAQIFIINIACDRENIINNAERKKTADPSNDLLNNFVFPNFIPIIAAIESDMLKTSKPIIAAFSLKIRVQRAAPITTHEAPVSIRYSIGRIIGAKKKIKIRLKTEKCFLPKSNNGRIKAREINHGKTAFLPKYHNDRAMVNVESI